MKEIDWNWDLASIEAALPRRCAGSATRFGPVGDLERKIHSLFGGRYMFFPLTPVAVEGVGKRPPQAEVRAGGVDRTAVVAVTHEWISGVQAMETALNWPEPADFARVLQDPKIAFRNPELRQITMVKQDGGTNGGSLRVASGRFANVYQGKQPDGRKLAVRVFTGPVHERRERYEAVAKYLKQTRPDSLLKFDYDDRGIRSPVNGKWYPLITMEWVSGDILFNWLAAAALPRSGWQGHRSRLEPLGRDHSEVGSGQDRPRGFCSTKTSW